MTGEATASTSPRTDVPEPLMQMIQGIQVTAILRPGIQLGVFDQIANGNNQASSIAAAVG